MDELKPYKKLDLISGPNRRVSLVSLIEATDWTGVFAAPNTLIEKIRFAASFTSPRFAKNRISKLSIKVTTIPDSQFGIPIFIVFLNLGLFAIRKSIFSPNSRNIPTVKTT
jgi:hypothetical protein